MIPLVIRLLGLTAPKWPAPWMKWAADIVLIAAVVLALWALHAHWERAAYNTAFNQGWTNEHNNHLVTLRSLDQALGIIKAKNAESGARAKSFADSKEADAKAVADLDRRYAATDATRARLEAISKVGGGDGPCRVPRAVSDALAGL